MRSDLTHIVLVIDRSGSMASQPYATEAINKFLHDQKNGPGEARLTMVEFDGDYNVVHKNINIKEARDYTLVPGGCTALLDAIGKAVSEAGAALAAMKEEDRPANVVAAVITDGFENASKEYKLEDVKEMIKHQTEVYNWHFVWLGADVSSLELARNLSFNTHNIARWNGTNINSIKAVYEKTSGNLNNLRSNAISGQSCSMGYSSSQRDAIMNPEEKENK